MFTTLLYIVSSIQFITVITMIYILVKSLRNHKKQSTFLTYCLKVCSVYALLLTTATTIPFYNVFFAALYCRENDNIHQNIDCYKGLYWLHVCVAVIGLSMLAVTSTIFTLLYTDVNPTLQIPFASPQNRIPLLKLVLKIGLPLYTTFDYTVIGS